MLLRVALVLSAFWAFAALSAPAYAQAAPPAAASENKSLAQWEHTFSDPAYCWGCELYSSMATVTMDVGSRGEAVFAPGAIAAMNAFMGLWVVWQLFLLASPTHANGPSQTIDTIFQRLVLMMVVLFILHQGSFNYIMKGYALPAIDGVMTASRGILGEAFKECGYGGGNQLASAGSGLMCSMHQEMGKGIGLGAFLMDSSEFSFWPGGKFEILQWVGGLAIALAFAWMMVMLPFRLFDAMIRIAVVSVILPVVVLAYQFKPTRGACKQAATSVLAAGLTFLFTAIAVAISVQLLKVVASPVIASVTDGSNDNGFIGPLGGREFMVLIAAAIGMSAFIKQAGSIATEFAGFQGSMGSVGGAGAGAVAGAAATGAAAAGFVGAKGVGAAAGGVKAAAGAASAKMSSSKGGGEGGGAGGAEFSR